MLVAHGFQSLTVLLGDVLRSVDLAIDTLPPGHLEPLLGHPIFVLTIVEDAMDMDRLHIRVELGPHR